MQFRFSPGHPQVPPFKVALLVLTVYRISVLKTIPCNIVSAPEIASIIVVNCPEMSDLVESGPWYQNGSPLSQTQACLYQVSSKTLSWVRLLSGSGTRAWEKQ